MRKKCLKVLNNLDDISEILDEPSGILFFKNLLKELESIIGKKIRFCLWLADMKTVCDQNVYGTYIQTVEDIDSYAISPILLSDLGTEGVLYGYESLPLSLEEQLEQFKNEQERFLLRMKELDEQIKELNDQIIIKDKYFQNCSELVHSNLNPLP